MINEAIILAGGLGTRLRSVIEHKPKCLAPVAGKPFLYYLIGFLRACGIENFIFCVGYQHEKIEEYLKNNYPGLPYQISLENEPLGTGGAIKLGCQKASQKNVLVCNGDTLYQINCNSLSLFHEKNNADCTLSLKPMAGFDRYGVVELNSDHSIKSFKEKKFYQTGLINGGVYVLNVTNFLEKNLPEKFSFEIDYLEKQTNQNAHPKLFGIIQDGYFIDIGIPADYEKAQKELSKN